MNILITGASGFIGRQLLAQLQQHQLWCLVRGATRLPSPARSVTRVEQVDQSIDMVINLAGENIGAKRWTRGRKQALRDSRIGLTQQLGQALDQAGQKPAHWINASAVGFYGDRPGCTLDEQAAPGTDFAAQLCHDWEHSAAQAAHDARLVILRLGVVLGPGGMLDKLRLPFRMGLGAVMGQGSQYMPWVALEDAVAVIVKAVNDVHMQGVYNLVAPDSVTQYGFAMALGQALQRPVLMRFPASMLRLMMGEMAELVLVDQKVSSRRLADAGYVFAYPDIERALDVALS